MNAPCDATVPCCDGLTCQSGTCADVNECAASPCQNGGTLADCNGNSSDGCEVNLQSDADSCGACGIVCSAGQICSNGTCQTAPTGQVPGTPVSSPANHSPLAPAVADVDGDGKLDILVGNAESGSILTPSGSLSVFLGNGDASVQSEVNQQRRQRPDGGHRLRRRHARHPLERRGRPVPVLLQRERQRHLRERRSVHRRGHYGHQLGAGRRGR